MSVEFSFDQFNDKTCNRIKTSIYNAPTAVKSISNTELEHIIEITDHNIRLLQSVCIINYYNKFRIIGFNINRHEYNMYTLPNQFANIMNRLNIEFKDLNYITIQDAQWDYIDYYQSVTTDSDKTKYELDTNVYKIYTLC